METEDRLKELEGEFGRLRMEEESIRARLQEILFEKLRAQGAYRELKGQLPLESPPEEPVLETEAMLPEDDEAKK